MERRLGQRRWESWTSDQQTVESYFCVAGWHDFEHLLGVDTTALTPDPSKFQRLKPFILFLIDL
jgi:hypothetical protein